MSPQDVLERAEQGEPQAIAMLLSEFTKPDGISVKVARQGDALYVLLESVHAPDPDTMVTLVCRGLAQLQTHSTKTVRIYWRQVGERVAAWNREVTVEEIAAVVATQQVEAPPPNSQPEPPPATEVFEPEPEMIAPSEPEARSEDTEPVATEAETLDSEVVESISLEEFLSTDEAPEAIVAESNLSEDHPLEEVVPLAVSEPEEVAVSPTIAEITDDALPELSPAETFLELEPAEEPALLEPEIVAVQEDTVVADGELAAIMDDLDEVPDSLDLEEPTLAEALEEAISLLEDEELDPAETDEILNELKEELEENELDNQDEADHSELTDETDTQTPEEDVLVTVVQKEDGTVSSSAQPTVRQVLRKPESLILLVMAVFLIFWQIYLQVILESEAADAGAISGRALARRLQVSASTVRRRRSQADFTDWTRSLDPDGLAWVYRADGKFVPLI